MSDSSTVNLDPLTNGSYWGPQEPEKLIQFENLYFVGIYFQTMATTTQFILYCICMKILWKDNQFHRRRPYFLMGYVSLLCATNVIIYAVSCVNLRLAYIDNRNFPAEFGGIVGYINLTAASASNVLGISSLVVGNIAADLLLLWRCRAIWTASYGSNNMWSQLVIVPPFSIFLASATLGILFDIKSAAPGGITPEAVQHIGVAYFSSSLGLNLILTGLIMYRMYSYKKVIASSLGQEHGRHYSSITTMFVESAALYTIASIPVVVCFSIQSPYVQVFLAISPAVQLICSYFIIWRVADGRAMSKSTFAGTGQGGTSSMVFNNVQSAGYSTTRTIGGSKINVNSKFGSNSGNGGSSMQLSPIGRSNTRSQDAIPRYSDEKV